MRIIVTGATGNVGTRVLRALAREGGVDGLVGLARRRPDSGPEDATSFVAADVASDDLVPLFRGADVIVHLAWLFQPTHAPTVTWQTNAVGSTRVFDAAAKAGVGALVYASSVGAYSPAPDDTVVDESWPTHSTPTAAYGREKAYVERALDAFEALHPNVRVVRMRPAFTFQRAAGTEQRRLFLGPFVPRRLLRRGALPMLPMPARLRIQAVHADDVAEAYRLAVMGDAQGAFNLAADPVLDGRALAHLLGARPLTVPASVVRLGLSAAWHLHVVPADPALFDLAMSLPIMDTAKARAQLGWQPRHTAADAVAEAVGGMASGAGGTTPPLERDHRRARLAEIAGGIGQRDLAAPADTPTR